MATSDTKIRPIAETERIDPEVLKRLEEAQRTPIYETNRAGTALYLGGLVDNDTFVDPKNAQKLLKRMDEIEDPNAAKPGDFVAWRRFLPHGRKMLLDIGLVISDDLIAYRDTFGKIVIEPLLNAHHKNEYGADELKILSRDKRSAKSSKV